MKIHIKMTRELYSMMIKDLERSHGFAYERVGFAYAKYSNGLDGDKIIILYDYQSVADVDYIKDKTSGARINSVAIRGAMQRILDNKEGCFHVHLHPFGGKPQLSRTDEKGILPLIPSFQIADPRSYHGIFLLGIESAIAYVWIPEHKQPVVASKISIIGYPMKIIR